MHHKLEKYLFIYLLRDFLILYSVLFFGAHFRAENWELTSKIDIFFSFLPVFILYEAVLYITGISDARFLPSTKRVFDLLLRAHIAVTVVVFTYFFLTQKKMSDPFIDIVIFSLVLFVLIFTWKILRSRLFNIQPIKVY